MKNAIHCNKLSSSLYRAIKNISRIRPTLDIDKTQTLIQAIILLRLDYCYSNLAGLSGKNMEKLQGIENMSCCIMQCLQKYGHILRPLKDLHWLKVPQRFNFKLATLMFKCTWGTAPLYLVDLVITPHNCLLRSTSLGLLPSVRCTTFMCHKGAFSSVGLGLWNSLPRHKCDANSIEQFIFLLKPHLFIQSHNT